MTKKYLHTPKVVSQACTFRSALPYSLQVLFSKLILNGVGMRREKGKREKKKRKEEKGEEKKENLSLTKGGAEHLSTPC